MSDPTEQRKLAAIMFTDMVDYSALSQRDDKLALELLLLFDLAALGERDEALKLLQEYDPYAAGDARIVEIGNEVRARSLISLSDKQGSIAILEKLMAAPSDPIFGPPMTPALLRLDPDFDSLRGDPRFQKLCQEK